MSGRVSIVPLVHHGHPARSTAKLTLEADHSRAPQRSSTTALRRRLKASPPKPRKAHVSPLCCPISSHPPRSASVDAAFQRSFLLLPACDAHPVRDSQFSSDQLQLDSAALRTARIYSSRSALTTQPLATPIQILLSIDDRRWRKLVGPHQGEGMVDAESKDMEGEGACTCDPFPLTYSLLSPPRCAACADHRRRGLGLKVNGCTFVFVSRCIPLSILLPPHHPFPIPAPGTSRASAPAVDICKTAHAIW
ncbi:hypothetical protein B0H16DRAFT_1781941 [Mycena metata]|uniref:Uncharacterized protein n=1 Tax=Mycena metata TaxID=1033252 RepID=A0AAD7HPN0_9AGAR|nr:hypothetical protein B0H16DRAFT_1781941 [Mycena metata]